MRIDLYLHSSKVSAREAGERAGLRGAAAENFMYAGSEHKMTYQVDEGTGDAVLVEVDDRVVAIVGAP